MTCGESANDRANAAHIAGMDPPTTIALVADLRAERARNERLVACLRKMLADDNVCLAISPEMISNCRKALGE